MSTTMSLIARGYFTSTAAAKTIALPVMPDYFEVFNTSTWGTAPTAVVKSWWYPEYAAGRASTLTEGGASALTATLIAAGGAGFTLVDYANPTLGAAIAITGINQAAGAVALSATTQNIGDIVRVYGTTGMLQIAGMDFTVTAVNAGVSNTFGYLDSSGFAAPGTGGNYRVVNTDLEFYPRTRYITAITAAASAVITMSVAHDYVVGSKVYIRVPAAFGMLQMDGKQATVTAISASTITVDVDSSAFTAFAFPTSAVAAAGVSFATVSPAGEVATILTSAVRNVGLYGIKLGTGVVGAAGNIMEWRAYKSDLTIVG